MHADAVQSWHVQVHNADESCMHDMAGV